MKIYSQEVNPLKHEIYCTDANCVPLETPIENVVLARAYVPFQKLCSLYSPIDGLMRGTIFPELDQPYTAARKTARRRGRGNLNG